MNPSLKIIPTVYTCGTKLFIIIDYLYYIYYYNNDSLLDFVKTVNILIACFIQNLMVHVIPWTEHESQIWTFHYSVWNFMWVHQSQFKCWPSDLPDSLWPQSLIFLLFYYMCLASLITGMQTNQTSESVYDALCPIINLG